MRVVLLALFAWGAHAGSVVIDAGQTQLFTAAAGATGYAWRFNGALQTNVGSSFAFPATSREVGAHWVSAETRWPGGTTSNEDWYARVHIVLPDSGAAYCVAANGADTNAGTLAATGATGLQPRVTCFYRFHAANGTDAAWADRTAQFTVPPAEVATLTGRGQP